MWTNPQETLDLVTFTEEILNEKFHFCASIVTFSLHQRFEQHIGQCIQEWTQQNLWKTAFKNFKWYGPLMQTISFQSFERLSSPILLGPYLNILPLYQLLNIEIIQYCLKWYFFVLLGICSNEIERLLNHLSVCCDV